MTPVGVLGDGGGVPEKSIFTYSSVSLVAGGVLGFALVLGAGDVTNAVFSRVLGVFNITFVPAGYEGPMEFMFAVTILGLLGYWLLFLSEKIDDELETAETLEPFIKIGVFGFYGLGLFATIYTRAVYESFLSSQSPGFGEIILGLILGLFGLFLLIPMYLFNYMLVPFTLMLVIAGLLCLPRVVMYYFTVHPLREVADRTAQQGQVPDAAMPDALSTPPKGAVQEQAMRDDLRKLLGELEETETELEREREVLRGNVREVAERKEAEARVSQRLARIDALLAENAQYKKQLKEAKADE